jgi:hypothetical protein
MLRLRIPLRFREEEFLAQQDRAEKGGGGAAAVLFFFGNATVFVVVGSFSLGGPQCLALESSSP